MKKFKEFMILIIFSHLFIYLLGAFIAASFNIINWDILLRILIAILSFVIILFSTIIFTATD